MRRYSRLCGRASARHVYRVAVFLTAVLLAMCRAAPSPSRNSSPPRLPLARLPPPSLYTFRGGFDTTEETFEIVKDEVLHSHWRRLIRRSVVMPGSTKAINFEIVAQTGTDQAVLVFVWKTDAARTVLIREYMPAVNRRMVGLAAGMVEDKHNEDNGADDDIRLTAAKHELEEECLLTGGTWTCLATDVTMDKYSTTRLSVYLVLDPEPIHVDDAKPRDAEEDIHVVPDVSVEQLREWIAAGELTVVGSWASLLALEKLRELGEIPPLQP